MSYFYYPDNQAKSKIRRNSLVNIDPNLEYLKHYSNQIFLTNKIKQGTFEERVQANKELTVCERKLKFWESRPGFSFTALEASLRIVRGGSNGR